MVLKERRIRELTIGPGTEAAVGDNSGEWELLISRTHMAMIQRAHSIFNVQVQPIFSISNKLRMLIPCYMLYTTC